ncbi:MAG: dTMP kinase [Sulfolobales archaeon]
MSRLIVVEGIDGSGKTTIAKKLVDYLLERGYKAYYTYEPSDSPFIEFFKKIKDVIERDPLIDALVMTLDRAYHVKYEIEPYISRGYIVVSDRYYHSTVAYQGAMGLDINWIINLNKYFRKPDLAIYLDVSIETALRRISGRRSVWPEYEQRDFLLRVKEIYQRLIENGELIRVDAERSFENVFHDVINLVNKILT